MIPVKRVRFGRTVDIQGGNLIAHQRGSKPVLGLNIAETKDAPRGVLWLYTGTAVEFEQTDLPRCLDLGEPIFTWTLSNPDFFFGQLQLIPGHLIVQGGSVLIAGHDGSSAARPLLAWNVDTGERAPFEIGEAALLNEWKLGVRDVDGRFMELLSRPPSRSFFG